MRKLMIAAAVAASLGALGAASAQSNDSAALTLAVAGPDRLIHDGAQWRCEGTACTAAKVKGVPALHACKRLVRQIGRVTAFAWRGKALDEAAIVACNAAAPS